METLQPTKQNDMVAINNNYKVSKDEHITDEDKTNKYTRRLRYLTNTLRTLLKLTSTKKLNSTSTTVHKTVHNYTLVNPAINIRKSNKE